MKKLSIAVIALNLVLVVVQLFFSTVRASGGVELNSLRAQAELLEKENNQIEALIAQKSSLATIEVSARNVGLKPVRTTALPPLTVAKAASTLP